jgi:riboflavin biosynthesis pyrimidine reductase
MSKPYVICHMGSTVDGRIISEHWGENAEKFGSIYEECHNTFKSDGWMVGRVTMEKNFSKGKKPELEKVKSPITREPFVADKRANSFAIAVDAHGKLGWNENEIGGDHLIEVLLESVSDEYLQYLQNIRVSYVFGGKDNIDFEIALSQLNDLFNIKTLMLEGGGSINGSLLNAGLIDELSLLILPMADGTENTATTFDVAGWLPKKKARNLKLMEVKKMESDVIWLRYKMI